MEKVRTYKRILAWLLVPAMLLGIVVPVMPQVTAYAEEANTESPVVLDENGVLKIESIDTVRRKHWKKLTKRRSARLNLTAR